MNTGIPLRARILGVLRNRCTCLTSRERSDMADDLCRAAEIDRAALEAERDRYREALESIGFPDHFVGGAPVPQNDQAIARAALDSDPDLAERTRRIRADE